MTCKFLRDGRAIIKFYTVGWYGCTPRKLLGRIRASQLQKVLAQAKGYAYVCKQLLLLGVCNAFPIEELLLEAFASFLHTAQCLSPPPPIPQAGYIETLLHPTNHINPKNVMCECHSLPK